MKKALIVLGVVCLGLVVWLAWVRWQLRDPFPHYKLRDLTAIMTTNDVQRLLGPTGIHRSQTNDAGKSYEVWVYGAGPFQAVYLQFTPDGHYQSYRVD